MYTTMQPAPTISPRSSPKGLRKAHTSTMAHTQAQAQGKDVVATVTARVLVRLRNDDRVLKSILHSWAAPMEPIIQAATALIGRPLVFLLVAMPDLTKGRLSKPNINQCKLVDLRQTNVPPLYKLYPPDTEFSMHVDMWTVTMEQALDPTSEYFGLLAMPLPQHKPKALSRLIKTLSNGFKHRGRGSSVSKTSGSISSLPDHLFQTTAEPIKKLHSDPIIPRRVSGIEPFGLNPSTHPSTSPHHISPLQTTLSEPSMETRLPTHNSFEGYTHLTTSRMNPHTRQRRHSWVSTQNFTDPFDSPLQSDRTSSPTTPLSAFYLPNKPPPVPSRASLQRVATGDRSLQFGRTGSDTRQFTDDLETLFPTLTLGGDRADEQPGPSANLDYLPLGGAGNIKRGVGSNRQAFTNRTETNPFRLSEPKCSPRNTTGNARKSSQ